MGLSIFFGPVPSRRLGYSFGIDLHSPDRKMCTLDCVYCQVGTTQIKSIKRGIPTPAVEVNAAIDRELPRADIDVVTFSGSGEPTLHKDLGQFIDRVKTRTDKPVVVLTNGTLMDRPDVRRDLAKADIVMPSLDAATPAAFARVNRPHASLRLDRIIDGMVAFRQEYTGKLWIEVMLVKGLNDDSAELMAISAALDRIAPDRVFLNTVVRPPAESFALPLPANEMARAATVLGPRATVVGEAPAVGLSADPTEVADKIVDLVRRRGVTIADVVKSLGLPEIDASGLLDRLAKENKIKKVVYGNVVYYRENF